MFSDIFDMSEHFAYILLKFVIVTFNDNVTSRKQRGTGLGNRSTVFSGFSKWATFAKYMQFFLGRSSVIKYDFYVTFSGDNMGLDQSGEKLYCLWDNVQDFKGTAPFFHLLCPEHLEMKDPHWRKKHTALTIFFTCIFEFCTLFVLFNVTLNLFVKMNICTSFQKLIMSNLIHTDSHITRHKSTLHCYTPLWVLHQAINRYGRKHGLV